MLNCELVCCKEGGREGEINHRGMRVGGLAGVLAIDLKNNFHCIHRLAILPMVYTPIQIPSYLPYSELLLPCEGRWDDMRALVIEISNSGTLVGTFFKYHEL